MSRRPELAARPPTEDQEPAGNWWGRRSRAASLSGLLLALAASLGVGVSAAGAQDPNRPPLTVTLTVDKTSISEPVRGGAAGQNVRITATLTETDSGNPYVNDRLKTGWPITLTFGGTAEKGVLSDPKDYLVRGDLAVWIPQGASSGSKQFLFETTDDGFWEQTETIQIGVSKSASILRANQDTAQGVSINLEDRDEQPVISLHQNLPTSGPLSVIREPETRDVTIEATLEGALVQAPITLSVTPKYPTVNGNFFYDPRGPWKLTIAAEERTARTTVKFNNPTDETHETEETLNIEGTASALGAALTVKPTRFTILGSDEPGLVLRWRIEGVRSLASDDSHRVKFKATLAGDVVPEAGVTLTLTPSKNPGWFTPGSQTLTWAREGDGTNCKNGCELPFVWDIAAPALSSPVTIGFTTSTVPEVRFQSLTTHRLVFLQSANPVGVVSGPGVTTQTRPTGNRPYETGARFLFQTRFDRRFQTTQKPRLRIYLDSGPVDVTNCAFDGATPDVLNCQYVVRRQDYDLDGKIEIRAGGLDLGDTVSDPANPNVSWTAPTVPATARTLTLQRPIYGTGHRFEAQATVQEGFREGAGPQKLTVLISDVGGLVAAEDITIPIQIRNGTTTGADWSVVPVEGEGSVTIPKGQYEARGTMTIRAELDGINESNETMLVGGSGPYPVKPDELILYDAAELNVTVTPTSIREGETKRLTFKLAIEDTAPVFNQDVTGLAVLHRGVPDSNDYEFTYDTELNPFPTLPAGQRSVEWGVSMTAKPDKLVEGDEILYLESRVPGYSVSNAQITIVDVNTMPGVTLSANPTFVTEGGGSQNVTVTASLAGEDGLQQDVTVTLALGGSCGDQDKIRCLGHAKQGPATDSTRDYTAAWTPTSKKITIPRGQTTGSASVTLEVTPLDDDETEGTESIEVQGTATNDLGVAPARVELQDNDEPGVIVAPRAITIESGTSNSYGVRLTTKPNLVGNQKVRIEPVLPRTLISVSPDELEFDATDWGTTKSFTVTADPLAEDEVVMLTHTVGGGNYEGFMPDSVEVTIREPPTVSLGIDQMTISENAGVATVTAVLSKASLVPVTLTVSAVPVPAQEGTREYRKPVATDIALSTNTTLSFAAGDTTSTGTVTITANNNDFWMGQDEPPKQFTVSGTVSGHNGIPDPADEMLEITDDDAKPKVAIVGGTAAEGDEVGVTFTVTRTGATGNYVGVNWKTTLDTSADAVAASAEDFTAVDTKSGTDATKVLRFFATETEKTLTIAVEDDDLDEPDAETFLVELTETTDEGEIATDGRQATGTITDNDDPPSFSITGATVIEGETVTFTVTRAGASENEATVKIATATDTDEDAHPADTDDYEPITTAQTITFGKEELKKTVGVATTDDDLYEPDDETFLATLSEPALADGDPGTGVSIAEDGGTAKGTIEDNDTQPSFSIEDVTGTEGTDLTFTVTRTGAADNAVAVHWNTKADSGDGVVAASTDDYTAVTTATKLDFAKDVTSVTFTVATTEDTTDEPDETFLVELTAPEGGAVIGVAEATGTITDDDETPTVTLALTPATINESGASNVSTVTASLNHPSYQAVTVAVSVPEGSPVTASANTTLTIAAGSTTSTGTVTLTAVDNNVDAPDVTVTVSGAASGGGVSDPADVTLTITDDDDTPTFSVADGAGNEGDGITFVVTRAGAAGNTVTVKWATAPVEGQAVAADFTAVAATTLTFAATETSKTVTVQTTEDTLDEPNETFAVKLTDPGKAADDPGATPTLTRATATGTIRDDDDAPSFSVADGAGNEGDGITFVVTRAGAAGNTVTVKWATALVEGQAVAADFTAVAATTLTFAATETSKTVTVQTTEDTLDEPNETFQVKLTEPGKAADDPGATPTLTRATATGTIRDDDDAPSFSVADGAGNEGDGITFVVTRAGAAGNTVTVKWATAPVEGQAVAADFTAVAATTLTFAATETSKTVTVQTTEDTLDEPNETFQVKLTEPGKAADDPGATPTLTRATATGTIRDDDDAPSFSVADGAGNEGDGITFVVTRAGAAGNTVTVKWATAPVEGQAVAADFTAVAATTLTFAATETSKTVTVQTTEDTLDEPNETFEVKLTEPGKAADDPGATPTLTRATATGTIRDDDDAPSFSVADGAGNEGDGITFVVTRAGAAGNTVTVKWATAPVEGQAVAADFTAVAATTLTFAATETSKTVTVQTTEDLLDEPNETFEVKLTDPGKAADDPGATPTLTDDTATGTIRDDDDAPSFSVADGAGNEGDGITFVVTRAGATANAVTVKWATALVEGQAVAADFTAVEATTLTFAATQTTRTVTVQTTEDLLDEPNETFEVTLTEPGKAADDPGATPTLTDDTATGTIRDDDDAPTGITLTASPDRVGEEDGATAITVTAGVNGTTRYVDAKVVTVSVVDDGATSPADYTAVSNFAITIAAGEASGTGSFTLTPVNDVLDEEDETIDVTGTSGALVVTGDEITIEDNDAAPTGITLTANPDSVGEEDGATVITVTAGVNGTTRYVAATPVVVSVGGGTAAATDYTAVSSFTITIAAGEASGTGSFTLTPVNDVLDEEDETILVSGTSGSLTVTGDTVTIEDNDDAPTGITLTANPDSVGEEDGATAITVTAGVNGTTRYVDAKVVTVSVGGGTATSVTDYAAVSNFAITIAAGEASGTGSFTLTPVNDVLDEEDETVLVGGTSGSLTVTGDEVTIEDNDAAPTGITLTANPDSVGEEDGATVITVTAAVNGTTRYVAATPVVVSVGGGTAAATDYTAVSSFTITIAAGEASGTGSFTLTPVNDVLDEEDETILVSGTSGSLTVTGDEVTIEDNDAAPTGITLTANPDRVGEEDGATAITVTAGVNGTTRYVAATPVVVSVGGGTAAATDYTAVSSFTITIAAGEASGTGSFTLTPVNDVLDEEDETILVSGTSGSLTVTGDEVTIEDNDAAPTGITLTANPDRVGEEDGATAITVTAGVNGTTRYVDAKVVTVSVGGGTATSVTDYGAVSNFAITIAAGEASGTGSFTLTPVNDVLDEEDETVLVSGTSGSLTVTGDEITIADDEMTPTVTLVLSPTSINESGGSNASTVTASLSHPSYQAVTVTVSAAAGADTATSDYTLSATTMLTIAAGSTTSTGTVTITAVDNDVDAPNKSVTVSGTASGGGVSNPTNQTLTITDDEGIPTVTLVLSPTSINESGGSNASTVTASLSHPSYQAVTVTVSAAPGASTATSDYALSTTTMLTIAAGSTTSTGTVTITAVDNDVDAPNKSVTVSGAASGGGVSNPADQTLTIADDEGVPAVTLALDPTSINESGASNVSTVTASLSGKSHEAVTITVSAAAGADTATSDYTVSANTMLTIAAGSTTSTGTVTITAVDNDVDAPNKSVTVSGAASGGGVANPTDQTLTITDDEGVPTVTLVLTPATIAESGNGNASTVTARLSGESSAAVTVEVSAAPGTGAEATDYTLSSNTTLTIAAGSTTSTGTVTITAVDNDVDAPNKSVTVSGAASGGGVANPTDQTLTITDDEGVPTVTLVLTPATIAENGNGNASTVTATLSGKSHETVTVTVSVPGTAPVTQAGTTLTIAAGSTTSTGTVTLTAVDNDVDAPNAQVTVSGAAAGGGVSKPADATLTITDDDTPTWTVGVSPASIAEDGGTSTVTVSTGGVTFAANQTIVLALTGTATETADYTIGSKSLTLTAGATSVTTTVAGVDDTLDDDGETVVITASVDGSTVGAAQTVTITDDDTLGWTVGVNPAAIAEDGGTSTVTVSTGGVTFATNQTIVLALTGTATETADYTIGSKSLTLTAGATSVTTTVAGVDDTLDDDGETVVITASVDGSTVGAAQTVTITDDDTLGWTVGVNPAAIAEDGGTSTVTVSTGGVTFATNQTIVLALTGTATETADYTIGSKSLTLTAGATSVTTTVAGVDDTLDDDGETVVITASVDGSTVGAAQTVTITDDDTLGWTVGVSPASIAEDGGTSTVTVSTGGVTFAANQTITLALTGTATETADYTIGSKSLTLTAGATSVTTTVTGVNDTLDDDGETVVITASVAGSTVGAAQTVTITDDDALGWTVGVNPAAIAEDGGTSTVTVSTGGVTFAANQTITLALTGTATETADYTIGSKSLTLTAGATSVTTTVAGVDDTLDDDGETVVITASVDGSTVGAAQTVTITDDDTLGWTVGVSPASIAEDGGTSTVTVSTGGVTFAANQTITLALTGTATETADYTIGSKSLTLTAGATSVTTTVTGVNDTLDDEGETVVITASVAGSTVGAAQTVTITDDDALGWTVGVSPASIAENGGVSTVTVSTGGVTFAANQTIVLALTGTATETADYTIGSKSLTLTAGATSVTTTVTGVNDTLDDDGETVVITASVAGSTVGAAQTVTITDDDALGWTVGVNPASIAEDGGTSTVTVSTGGVTFAANQTIVLALTGTATETADYTIGAKSLTLTAGATSVTTTVTGVNDTLDDDGETVVITASVAGSTVGAAQTVTITDDDALGWTVGVNPASIAEDGGTSTVTVSTGGVTFAANQTIVLALTGTATETADYTIGAKSLTLTAGATSVTTTVTGVNDTLDDDGETVVITASVAGSTVGTAQTITITDDDAAPGGITLSASPGSVGEDDGATEITVTASVGGGSRYSDATAVTVSVADDSATSPADYAAVSNFTITIAAGAASGAGTFTLTPVNDNLVEGLEHVAVTGAAGSIQVGSTSVEIRDADSNPDVRIQPQAGAGVDARVAEEGGAQTVTVEVGVVGATRYAEAKTVAVSVADGTASSPGDYAAVSGFSVTIAAEAASGTGTFTVTPVDDVLVEGDETIGVSGILEGATVLSGTVTIVDDDTAPTDVTLTANPDTVDEDDSPTTVTVTAALDGSKRFTGATNVAVSVGGGTAISGTDYTAVSAFTITIAAGAGSGTGAFTLTPTDDDLAEGSETLDVTGTATGLTVTKDTITITDADTAPAGITLTANPDSVAEGASGTGITVTAAVKGTTRYVDQKAVTVSVGGGTAISGTDYTAVSAFTITIAAGTASGTGSFTLTPTDDALDEDDETLDVTGSATGVTVEKDTITITDDDDPPTATLVLTPTSINESGDGNESTVTATLDGPARAAVTLTVSSTPGDGAAAADFDQTGTTLTIAAGSTGSTGSVTITAVDNAVHASDKQVTVSATASGGGVSNPADQTLTIEEDDAAPGFSVADASASEGEVIEFTITLSSAAGTAVTVDWATTLVDGGASATDFTAVSATTLSFAAGDTTKTVTVQTTEDTLAEPNETFSVTLSNPTGGATIAPDGGTATGTITDDDAAPSFSVADASAAEGENIEFTITRSGATGNVVTVDWATALVDGQASATDFTEVSATTLSFAAGDTTKTVTVQTTEDTLAEPNETFSVTLSNPTGGATIAPDGGTATGTITDDDAAPSFSVADASAPEGEDIEFTITRSGATGNAVTLDWATTLVDGGAAATDFTEVTATTLSFAAGETTKTVTVETTEDTLAEEDETFSVTLSTPTGGATIATDGGTATGTIQDDDVAPNGATLSVAPAIVGEDEGATEIVVTATVDGNPRTTATELTISVDPDTAQQADFEEVADFTLTIEAAAASGTATFTLTPVNDLISDDQETIIVSGTTTVPNYEVTSATITLNNYDPPATIVNLEALPASVAEDADPTEVEVTARFGAGHRGEDTEVTVSVAGDTASAADFTAVPSFTVTILAGEPAGTGTFTFVPVDDAVHEGEETVAITGATTVADLTVNPTSLTLTDNDDAPGGITLKAAPDRVAEGAGATPVTVTASVDGGATFPDATTVAVSVGGGTAVSGTDYEAVSSFDITIAVGEASGTGTFTLTPVDDSLAEGTETMEVTGTSGDLTVTPDEITIEDNDDAPGGITLTAAPDSVAEGAGATTVTVTASVDGGATFPDATTVAVSVGGGTATVDTDYAAVSSFDITIAAGAASGTGTFTLTPVDDALHEGSETIAITGTTTVAELTVKATSVTLTDNDEDGPDRRIYIFELPEAQAGPRVVGDVAESGDPQPVVYEMLSGDAQRFGVGSSSGNVRYVGAGEDYESGPRSFRLEVELENGPIGHFAMAYVNVRVIDVPEPPEPRDDRVTTPEDTPILIAVLENDSDPDGDEVRITGVGQPENGTATIRGERILYSPDLNWYGTDRFEYTVSDPGGLTGRARVTVLVTPVNDPPEAQDDEAETLEDHAILIGVLDNDTDVDGDELELVAVGPAENGRTALAGEGLILYTPDRDWFGTDRFEYRVADPEGLDDTATVTVVVWPVNDAPYAIGAIPSQHVEEGGESASVELTPYFGDVDDLVLTYAAVSSNEDAVSVSVTGATLTLVPVVTGEAVVTVTASDAEGLSATQVFAVTVGDELVRAVLTDIFAGFGRAHLSSLRSTLGRRLATGGSDGNRFTMAGQYLSSAGSFGQIGMGGIQQTQEMAFGAASWEQVRRAAALGGTLTDPAMRLESAGNTTSRGSGLGSFGGGGEGRWLRSTDLLFSFGGQDEDERATGRRWTVWGQGDIQTFRGEESTASVYDGDLQTAYLGLDLALGDRWLVGVGASHSMGAAEWTVGGSSGDLDTGLTAVHPYLRWSNGDTSVWALGGFGEGDAEGVRDLTGLTDQSPLQLGLGLVEGRQRLGTTRFGLGVDAKAEASWARLSTGAGEETLDDLSAEVRRLRTGIEMGIQLPGPAGLTLAPFTAVSTLHDGGDGPQGFGLEVAGGLRVNGQSVRVEAQGRRLVLHAADNYREQGFSVNASFGGGLSQPGWNASVRQRWGASGVGADTLWQDHFAPQDQSYGSSSGGLDSRVGYGLPIGSSKLLSAFGGYGQMQGGRRVEVGMNLGGLGLFGFGADNPVLVEFAGERYDAGGLTPDYRMRLYGVIRFGGEVADAPDSSSETSGLSGWRPNRTELTPGGEATESEESPPSGTNEESR